MLVEKAPLPVSAGPDDAEEAFDAICGESCSSWHDEVAGDDLVCSVCLDPIRERAWRELTCGHRFHESCVLKWAQAATQPHCPLCRFDLEASALAEFEKAFGCFRETMVAATSQTACNFWDAATALEDGRRRLFDAVLVRFQKLHREDLDPCDPELLKEDRLLFTELLCQLHALRPLLLRLRPARDLPPCAAADGPEWGIVAAKASAPNREDGEAAALLADMAGALHGVQVAMKHVLHAGGDIRERELLKQYANRISEICRMMTG